MQKIALVTGISGGIGSAIANELTELGYFVVGLEKEISQNIGIEQIQFDLSDIKGIKEITENLIKEFGVPEILINNAGVYYAKNWEEESIDEFQETLTVNVTAPFILTQTIGQKMIDNKIKGKIINITSVCAFAGGADIAYAASKAGLTALTKSIAKEFAKYEIKVNAIAPGPVNTKMGNNIPQNRKEHYKELIPLHRFAEPKEIANIVKFLIDENSSYITGTTIHLNGGLY